MYVCNLVLHVSSISKPTYHAVEHRLIYTYTLNNTLKKLNYIKVL